MQAISTNWCTESRGQNPLAARSKRRAALFAVRCQGARQQVAQDNGGQAVQTVEEAKYQSLIAWVLWPCQ